MAGAALVALLIGQGLSFSSTAPTSKPIGSSSGALSMSAQHNDELNGSTGRRDFISRVAAAAVLASSQRPAYAADDEAATSPPPPAPSPTMKGQESFDMQTFLTKKRYQVSTPEFDTKAVMKGKAFAVKKWNDSGIQLSNIEAAAAAAIVSYPLAYIQFLWSDYVDVSVNVLDYSCLSALPRSLNPLLNWHHDRNFLGTGQDSQKSQDGGEEGKGSVFMMPHTPSESHDLTFVL